MEYAVELAMTLSELHGVTVKPLGGGIPTTVREVVDSLVKPLHPHGAEVFIEIDRAALPELEGSGLLPYLYPVAVRFDAQGDAVITVTTADRAQFGTDVFGTNGSIRH